MDVSIEVDECKEFMVCPYCRRMMKNTEGIWRCINTYCRYIYRLSPINTNEKVNTKFKGCGLANL